VIELARRHGRPLCIGHRGAPLLEPENTIRSFHAAIDAGVDLVELDVLELHSGELVVAHSDDLREISHGAAEGVATGWTLAALHEVAPELPTLDEALELFAVDALEVGVHLDLKSASAAEAVLASLRRRGLVERSIVSSFERRALRRLATLEPTLRTGVSFPPDRLGISERRGSAPFVRAGLSMGRRCSTVLARFLLARSYASTLVLHHELVSSRTVDFAHARGVRVVAWTVDDAASLHRLDEAGVDAVVVNNPGLFLSTLVP
jgi:glycerophosphoryl diester phosphodiesterase